jgi:aspartate aminotransferase
VAELDLLPGPLAAGFRRGPGIRSHIVEMPGSKIGEVAALGHVFPDLIPLWYGESDQPTPDFICEAAIDALRRGHTFYGPRRGLEPLLQALADYLTRHHRRPVTAERIAITSAGMNAIMLAAQVLIEPGDNIVVLSPVWPNITGAIESLGGEPLAVALDPTETGGWRLDLDRLLDACNARTRAIFLNSPSNPTGWIMSPAEASEILDFARRRGLWLIADKVYERLVYDRIAYERGVAPSFLDIAEPEERVLIINSFSKTWAMTGWRLGWMIAPREIEAAVDKLIEVNTSGAPPFLQYGALAAIRQGEGFVADFVERCRRNRDLVLDRLSGFDRVRIGKPEGGFYAFFRVESMEDSVAFAKDIVRRAGVGLAPGAAFGPAGEGHLRLCFACTPERLHMALDRLAPLLS